MSSIRPSDSLVPQKDCKQIVSALNSVLANEYALFTKTLNYHWNVTGPRFHSLHTFLEGHYRDLLLTMDEVAERVRILGDHPISTIRGMYSAMELQDGSEKKISAEDMLTNLLNDHQTIQVQLKEIVSDQTLFAKDPGSADMLTGMLQKHEKMSWMLKSHLV